MQLSSLSCRVLHSSRKKRLLQSRKIPGQNSGTREIQPSGQFAPSSVDDLPAVRLSESLHLRSFRLSSVEQSSCRWLGKDRVNSSLMQPGFAYPFCAAMSGTDTGHSRASESSNMFFLWGRSHFWGALRGLSRHAPKNSKSDVVAVENADEKVGKVAAAGQSSSQQVIRILGAKVAPARPGQQLLAPGQHYIQSGAISRCQSQNVYFWNSLLGQGAASYLFMNRDDPRSHEACEVLALDPLPAYISRHAAGVFANFGTDAGEQSYRVDTCGQAIAHSQPTRAVSTSA